MDSSHEVFAVGATARRIEALEAKCALLAASLKKSDAENRRIRGVLEETPENVIVVIRALSGVFAPSWAGDCARASDVLAALRTKVAMSAQQE